MSLDQSAGFFVHFARARDIDKGECLPCCRGQSPRLLGILLGWRSGLAVKNHDHGLDLATGPGLRQSSSISVS